MTIDPRVIEGVVSGTIPRFEGTVSLEDVAAMPEEYRDALQNILTIHTVSELYGADRFYPSVQLAPTPRDKWHMARIVAEEYGHHLRFARLQEELGADVNALQKAPLTIFEPEIESWTEQMVFLAVVDRAARFQFEDFQKGSYLPLRRVAEQTLAEEIGHAEFGRKSLITICQDPAGRRAAQACLDKWCPIAGSFFGRSGSRRSEQYRRWGLKVRTNDEMRAAWLAEMNPIIERDWRLGVPNVGDLDQYREYGG